MQVYKAIKYIRLSYTDDKTVESDSVANQRRLIDDYIARHRKLRLWQKKLTMVIVVFCLTALSSRK